VVGEGVSEAGEERNAGEAVALNRAVEFRGYGGGECGIRAARHVQRAGRRTARDCRELEGGEDVHKRRIGVGQVCREVDGAGVFRDGERDVAKGFASITKGSAKSFEAEGAIGHGEGAFGGLESEALDGSALREADAPLEVDAAGHLLGEEGDVALEGYLRGRGAGHRGDDFGKGHIDELEALGGLELGAFRLEEETVAGAVEDEGSGGGNLASALGDDRLNGRYGVPDAVATDGALRRIEGDATVGATAGRGEIDAQVEDVLVLVEADGESAVAPGGAVEGEVVAIGFDDGEVDRPPDAVQARVVDERWRSLGGCREPPRLRRAASLRR